MAVEGRSDYRERLVRRKRRKDQERANLKNTKANAGPPSANTFSTPAPKAEGGVSGAVKGFFLDWAEPATKVALNALGSSILGLSAAQGTTSFGGNATQMNRGTDPRVASVLGDPATLGNRLTSEALELAPVDEAAKERRRELWASDPTASTYALAASDFVPDPLPPGVWGALGSVAGSAAITGLKPVRESIKNSQRFGISGIPIGRLEDVVTGPRKGVKGPRGPNAEPTDVSLVDDSTNKRLAAAVKRGDLNPQVQEALNAPLPVVQNIEDYTQRLVSQLGEAPVVGIPGKVDPNDLPNYKGSIVVSTNKDGTISMATPPVFVDDLGVPHFVHNYPFGVRNAAGSRWQEGMGGYYDEAGMLLPEVAQRMEDNVANVFTEAINRNISPAEWYTLYNDILIKDQAARTGLSEWNIAGALAALSPQTPYPANVADLVDLIRASSGQGINFNSPAGARAVGDLVDKVPTIAAAGSPFKTGGQSGTQTLTALRALSGMGTPADTQIGKTPSFQWANFDPLGNELRSVGGENAGIIYFTRPDGTMLPVSQSTFDIMMARVQGGQVIGPGDALPKGGLVQRNTGEFSEPLSLDAKKWAGVSDIPGRVLLRPEIQAQMKEKGLKGGTNTIQSEDWVTEQLLAALLKDLLGYGGTYRLPKFK